MQVNEPSPGLEVPRIHQLILSRQHEDPMEATMPIGFNSNKLQMCDRSTSPLELIDIVEDTADSYGMKERAFKTDFNLMASPSRASPSRASPSSVGHAFAVGLSNDKKSYSNDDKNFRSEVIIVY